MELTWQNIRILIENIDSVDERVLQEKPREITKDRWERIQKIRPLDDKKRSLLAGRLLYQMCQECGVENPEYGIQKNGKPVLRNHPEIAFSVSHSGEYVVVAFSYEKTAIGVDIQQVKVMSEGLKRRLLNEKEYLWLEEERSAWKTEMEAGGIPNENICLSRIWAIKESYVKMTGEGLAHDFRNVSVDMEQKQIFDENENCAVFMELEAPEGYVLAVVMDKL